MCKVLLDACVNINTRNTDYQRTPLHMIRRIHRTVEVVDMLVQAGIHVDVGHSDHETPLLKAVFWHHIAIAKRLFELGADVNARDIPSQDNTVRFAVSYSHREKTPALLAHEVEYVMTNVRSRDIAYMAAIFDNTEKPQCIDKLQVDKPRSLPRRRGW